MRRRHTTGSWHHQAAGLPCSQDFDLGFERWASCRKEQHPGSIHTDTCLTSAGSGSCFRSSEWLANRGGSDMLPSDRPRWASMQSVGRLAQGCRQPALLDHHSRLKSKLGCWYTQGQGCHSRQASCRKESDSGTSENTSSSRMAKGCCQDSSGHRSSLLE